jgi:hypothetical protein
MCLPAGHDAWQDTAPSGIGHTPDREKLLASVYSRVGKKSTGEMPDHLVSAADVG